MSMKMNGDSGEVSFKALNPDLNVSLMRYFVMDTKPHETTGDASIYAEQELSEFEAH